ncbi:hypothetical protein GXN76_06005 [Kroppenstedtia pulmonis]|uniref:DUF5668 domain-containing protein n=1 Tax=Kroppenstedtia pulmonis TaxID=1380685 RepID=A0A7D4BJ31_9BACL|nr:hypothetical protein [Kroppenstedtia pulmonis]QKG84070.1 hypothetical protein GXN76_06005 [Kroppenstedtia pulmonis]
MHHKTIGTLLALAGVFLLWRKLDWPLTDQLGSWEFLLILVGLVLLFLSLRHRKKARLQVWGGIALGLGIHAWGSAYWSGWPHHWSIIPAVIGSSFLLFGGFINKDRKSGLIGATLILLGLFTWPGINNIPVMGEAASWLSIYWPVMLILLGLILFFRKG